MGKVSKNKRIGVITKILTENPNTLYTLNYFTEKFNCAKSTLSEDIDVIEEFFEEYQLGKIESFSGASGGIIYQPKVSTDQIENVKLELCQKIKEESRLMPGGYLYMNDIFYEPGMAYRIGKALANHFLDQPIDYVVTIETKGIPLALMTARILNKPMVVVRKSSRLTEGTAIQMNYITGSSKTIKTMSLAKKAIEKGSKIVFIDDFMKAGGTAKGIIDLMNEFEAEVVGIGVVMATKHPEKKLVDDFCYLVELEDLYDNEKEIKVLPNNTL
ncbi:purine operon repressor PurR [Natranaerovirga hydrolytica]|uniref:Purine operon repressor PurR n=1 Tax=Natranaerovirga hydrolytica TaxID=680378 RepID=A0A4R1M938_9FIRM|nr:pur operon repressor [Natranaerovirga hydrolytica]TCK87880.1 purine operon repressor PurR [Natranaerovirga hydrolytica]